MTKIQKKKILITTAIDYTNDVIHIGQAYEKILADSFARYHRLLNKYGKVGFVTGTDEHGTTNEKAAKKLGIDTKTHVDNISKQDKEQIDSLNISYDRFIRTTDEDHKKTASNFFKKSYENGDIYKGTYEGLYCEGCESYKTLNELNDQGQCTLHPTREIQKYKEDNYFFAWSKYTDFLKGLVQNERFVLPEGKKREMLAFIENGIQDIPITRPKFKLPWGITCPIDEEQVIYVWFDALINYFTFGNQNNLWDEETKIVHFVGKDIARWHSLLWPSMLKSAGYSVPTTIYVHGFINLKGEKISKSRGNVIRPSEIVSKYGTDAIRYYFLRYGPVVEDVDLSIEHLESVYNGELANGLGNAAARIAKLAENSGISFKLSKEVTNLDSLSPISDFRTDLAIQNVWKKLSALDKHINENEPWKIKDKKRLGEILSHEVEEMRNIATLLEPFMPTTSSKMKQIFNMELIKTQEALFPRI